MGNLPRFGGILLLITVIAAGSLAGVNLFTKPRIDVQEELEVDLARQEVLKEASQGVFVPDSSGRYFRGYARSDTTGLVGYVFTAEGSGYSSTVKTVVGVDTTGAITAIKVISQAETPGLGAKIVEPKFQDQFKGKRSEDLLVGQDGGPIDAITGATISSRVVTNSVRQKLDEISEVLGGFRSAE